MDPSLTTLQQACSFREIANQFQSIDDLIESFAANPLQLTQLFKRAVGEGEEVAALAIGDQIITDISTFPLGTDGIIEIGKIAYGLKCIEKSARVNSVVREIKLNAARRLSVGRALALLGFSTEALSKAGNGPVSAEMTEMQILQKLSLKALKELWIEVVIVHDFFLTLKIVEACKEKIVRWLLPHGELELQEAPLALRLAMCRELADGQEGTKNVLRHLDQFYIDGATPREKFHLCWVIAMRGHGETEEVAKCIAKFNFTLEERLELCRCIARDSLNGCSGLLKNIDAFDIGLALPEEHLELCLMLEKKNNLAAYIDKFNLTREGSFKVLRAILLNLGGAEQVADNFEKFDLKDYLSLQGRVVLCECIIARSGGGPLARNFDKFYFDDAPLTTRLQLCLKIVDSGARPAAEVADNFEKFNLELATSEERYKLCMAVLKQSAGKNLAQNLYKFNLEFAAQSALCDAFIEENCCSDLICHVDKFQLGVDRLRDIYQRLICKKGQLTLALARNIDKFMLDVETRCEFVRILIEFSVDVLIGNFYKLKLSHEVLVKLIVKHAKAADLALIILRIKEFDMPISLRMELCLAVASQGGKRVVVLVETLEAMQLQSALMDDRLKLCLCFIELKCLRPANIDELDLASLPIDQKLMLCHLILSKGESSGALLARNLYRFQMGEETLLQKLELFHAIVDAGEQAAASIALCLKPSDLQDVPIAEQIKLCFAIAEKGGVSSKHLAKNISSFSIDQFAKELRLELSMTIICHGDFAAAAVIKTIRKFVGDDFSAPEIMKLCLRAAAQGPKSRQILADSLHALNLHAAPIDARLQLCHLLIAAKFVRLENIERLHLYEAAIEQRIELYKAVACRLREDASPGMIQYVHKLLLGSLTHKQKSLCLDVPAQNLLLAYEFLAQVYESHLRELQRLVMEKLRSCLDHPDTSPDALLEVAQLILTRAQRHLHIHFEHPLMQTAIEIVSASEVVGAKNPFSLYKQLKELVQIPITCCPPVLSCAGLTASINLEQMKTLSLGVARKDLPLAVTKETFATFYADLKGKIVKDSRQIDGEIIETYYSAGVQALKRIHMELSWALIDEPFRDADRLLLGLLEMCDGAVSELEAKWKAVLSAVFNKCGPGTTGYFTEKEEVFMHLMMHIQKCSGGKINGIHLAYDDLENEYKYLILSGNVEEHTAATANKEQALKELTALLSAEQTQSPQSGIDQKDCSSGQAPIDVLLNYCQKGSFQQRKVNFWVSAMTYNDPHVATYFDEITFDATLAGLEAIVRSCCPEAQNFVAEVVRKVLSQQFNSGTLLMQELTGDANPTEGAHQSLFLKNLIGPIIGATSGITFDRHTGVICNALLEKSREQILEIFFRHLTPKCMADALISQVKVASVKEKAALRLVLPGQQWWTAGDATLSLGGALEALRFFKYIVLQ